MQYHLAQIKKAAFTLTEIAIVLGIIGLIIGAIWSAASGVYENLRQDRATNQLMTVVNTIRTLYPGGSSQILDTNPAFQNTLVALGAFPPDLIVAGNPVNPWGDPVQITVISPTTYTINMANSATPEMDAGSCTNYLVRNAGAVMVDNGLLTVAGAFPAPISPTTARSACGIPAKGTVMLFKLL
ncbi:MAG: hypothetical protein WAO98_10975 [Alphaproteobacteria bacterium]